MANGISPLQRQVRRAQTARAAEALELAIAGWVTRRTEADRDAEGGPVGRHTTQLRSIQAVLGGATSAVSAEAQAIDADADPLDVYRRCRQVDEACAWLQRLWDFYREKFDQRDGTDVRAATVKAADEIVWSVYHQVMDAGPVRRKGVEHGPAPLPFIAPEYSPGAVGTLARSLALPIEFPTWDEGLKKLVARLAVPLLVLPPWCVGAPWWLVFIAHEVGHHLTKRLEIFGALAESIEGAVSQATGDAGVGRTWRRWTEEIAADAWSVVLIGPAATAGLVEIELGNEAGAMASSTQYPPPAARLAVMRRFARRVQLVHVPPPVQLDLDAPAFDAHGAQRRAADGVATALGERIAGFSSLADLADLRVPDQANAAAFWRDALGAETTDRADTLSGARDVVAGTFAAWRRLFEGTPSLHDHTDGAATLARRALAVLSTAGPPGTRDAGTAAAPEVGKDLAARLLSLSLHRQPDVAADAVP